MGVLSMKLLHARKALHQGVRVPLPHTLFAVVDHDGGGLQVGRPAGQSHAVAEIGFLEVQEEPLVESSDGIERRATDQQGRALGPVDLAGPRVVRGIGIGLTEERYRAEHAPDRSMLNEEIQGGGLSVGRILQRS
jgi:hypothetical protein